ncbi:DUF805 domain-containing protein [Bradyrhizobium manausense]|uniref:DUF805 domain-containing protein n=1 Tax=Bradyrhizobium TaxID=374 RepID=UPI001BAE30A3|nr:MULTISPECIES: DUF805 domain-containing protein [Bradyrhizobium]MBR0829481.1 DUF805 domain-containing protein [Bradyrhizobium manausense]UVO25856.1 DUF805 domain-containing protein [Bradyrhizobium arachidis]
MDAARNSREAKRGLGLTLLTTFTANVLSNYVGFDKLVPTMSYLLLFLPVAFWMQSNLMTARLHDSDRSAWFQLVYWVPVLTLLVVQFWMGYSGSSDADLAAMKRGTRALAQFINLFICLPKGSKGPNQWGDDPLAPHAGRVQFEPRVEPRFERD